MLLEESGDRGAVHAELDGQLLGPAAGLVGPEQLGHLVRCEALLGLLGGVARLRASSLGEVEEFP